MQEKPFTGLSQYALSQSEIIEIFLSQKVDTGGYCCSVGPEYCFGLR